MENKNEPFTFAYANVLKKSIKQKRTYMSMLVC